MSAEDRIERARLLYERAVYGGDASALATADRELDAVEADLALARGRVIHTRFLAQLDEELERLTEDPRELALFEALRHLGIAEHRAGRLDTARQRLEESVRLRQEIGLMPGVAANLVGLAYIAAGDGYHDEALALLKEAGAIAEASGAHRITRQVEESRAQL
jgi:tetratricopeptide (TPR) repeat protein